MLVKRPMSRKVWTYHREAARKKSAESGAKRQKIAGDEQDARRAHAFSLSPFRFEGQDGDAVRGRGAGVPHRRLSTLISSSTSGQWMIVPSPMSSNRPRCSGVAASSLHDQAKGTLILRPSTRWTRISSSVT